MKLFIIGFIVLFVSVTAFSQHAKGNTDTTLKNYLTYHCTKHPQYVSNVAAKCPVCHNEMTMLSKKEQIKTDVVKLYTCPMDKDIISTKSGKCPVCDMNLVELKPKHKANKE